MKRKFCILDIDAPMQSVKRILENVEEFIINWPYVVKIRKIHGIVTQIRLPRFIFSFEDEYIFSIKNDQDGYIYEGKGKRSTIKVLVLLEPLDDKTNVTIEVAYSGKREFLLGKTIEELAKGIGKTLKEMAEAVKPTFFGSSKTILEINFDDPMSLASFLSKSKMIYTGIHIIQKGRLFDSLMRIISNYERDIFYISGINQDGTKSFKVVFYHGKIIAVQYRDSNGIESVKVTGNNQDEVIKAFQIADMIEGVYMINIWVPIGGV